MVKLRTLGECVAEIGATRLGPDAERLFAVLLCLGIERNRLASRGAMTSLLWPDVSEERGSHSLRQAVYRLRALGVPVLSDRSNLWIEPAALEIDAGPLFAAGPEPDGFVHQLRGTFLAGYHPKFSDPFNEWLDRQRDLVNARIRRVFLAEIGRLKSRGDWAEVECMAARCLAIDPFNEEATLAKAEAAALQGGKTQALAILDGYLKEVGPQAREIRLPATVLRRRIAEATNLDRPRAITETPFFGRAQEMAVLNRALQMAHAGSGSAHVFWGEPGIGKTRLMQEFTRAVSLGHAGLVRVGCQSNDDRRPLSMFVDMLPRLMGMPGALGCAPTAMRYLRRLTEHDPKEPLAQMDPRDAAMVYANIRKSLLDLLDAVASEGLLVIVIEDVHWLDMGSWDVISDALSWLSSRRVLLLLTAREPDAERKRGIGELPGLQRHHLPPLDRAAVDALSATIVERSGKPLPPDVAEWCADSCGGNPYHLTELVLHGLREGQTAKLPASLSQLISERLARLQPLSLHVLQGVSVRGAQSTLDRLERLLDQRRLDLLDALDELERSGLIESEPSRLLSKHELLSQAAVQRLSVAARRLLHRHAATVLERDAEVDHAPVMQWACAEHWREAGEVGRALSYLQECARHALESGAAKDALDLLERSLVLARNEDEREAILLRKASALQHLGDWLPLRSLLQSMSQREPGASTAARLGHDDGELLLYQTSWRTGAPLATIYPSLLTCVTSPDAPVDHRIEAGIIALTFCDNDRRSDLAENVYQNLLPFLTDQHSSSQQQLIAAVIYHCSFGDLSEAERASALLVRLAREQQQTPLRVRGLMIGGTALRETGHEMEAHHAFAEAFTLAKRSGMLSAAANSASSLAALMLQRGDTSVAAPWLEAAEAVGSQTTDVTAQMNVVGLKLRYGLQERSYGGLEQLASVYAGSATTVRLRCLSDLVNARINIRLKGQRPTDAEVRRLHELHEILGGSFSSDLSAIAIIEAFRIRNESEASTRFLQQYLANDRRSRGIVAYELRHPWNGIH